MASPTLTDWAVMPYYALFVNICVLHNVCTLSETVDKGYQDVLIYFSSRDMITVNLFRSKQFKQGHLSWSSFIHLSFIIGS